MSSFLEEAADHGSDEWFIPDRDWYPQAAYRDELVGRDNADISPQCRIRG